VSLGKKQILIVEDEEGIQTLLRLSLEMYDYEVVSAANGKEGLARLSEMEKPGLILLDYMMPVMNGRDFADELVRNPEWADIPIGMMSAFAERSRSVKNVVAVIDKPIDLPFLLDLVKQHCG